MTTPPLLLLVEDHDLVLEFLQCMFLEAGYAVTAVSSGVAALAALKADPQRFCAVVTDIHLGSAGPSGWEIGREARALAPEMPVVYTTAEGTQDWSAKGVSRSTMVRKPFLPDEMVAAVADLLVEAASLSRRSAQSTVLSRIAASGQSERQLAA